MKIASGRDHRGDAKRKGPQNLEGTERKKSHTLMIVGKVWSLYFSPASIALSRSSSVSRACRGKECSKRRSYFREFRTISARRSSWRHLGDEGPATSICCVTPDSDT